MQLPDLPPPRPTAWPREPSNLLAIATSEATVYDRRGDAWVSRALFPHLGEELVLFCRLTVPDPNAPSLRRGAFAGVVLATEFPDGWRAVEMGEPLRDPGHSTALVHRTVRLDALAPWLSQSHLHIVVVDARGPEPRIGNVFELELPHGDPVIDALRRGQAAPHARLRLEVTAGTRREPVVERPEFDDEDAGDEDDFERNLWWLEEIETIVRSFELVDRIDASIREMRSDDLDTLQRRLEHYGGRDLLGLAVDIMELFEPGIAWLLREWWQPPDDEEEMSELRICWRAFFGLDGELDPDEAHRRQCDLHARWTGRPATSRG